MRSNKNDRDLKPCFFQLLMKIKAATDGA